MSVKDFKTKKIIIGVQDVRFCKVLADNSGALTFAGDVYKAPGVVEIGLAWAVTEESIAADNVTVWEIVNSIDSVEVSITMASLANAARAYLLGHQMDTTGGVIVNTGDIAPDVAMGFKSLRSDGKADYCWLYKGKFKPSDETFRTKEKGSVNWQTPKYVGTFAPTINNGMISHHISEGDPTVNATSLATYLDTVFVPTKPTETLTITAEPSDANVTAGSISGTLTVTATATGGGTPTYLWYQNTTDSNDGGTALATGTGYNAAALTIPPTLTAGTYYYYCVVSCTGAISVVSQPATVTVAAS